MVAEFSRRAKAIEEVMIEKAQAAEAERHRELTKRVPHERGEAVLVLEAVHVVQVDGAVDQSPSQDEHGRGARPGVGTSLRSGRLPVESRPVIETKLRLDEPYAIRRKRSCPIPSRRLERRSAHLSWV